MQRAGSSAKKNLKIGFIRQFARIIRANIRIRVSVKRPLGRYKN